MPNTFNENDVEKVSLNWLNELGYTVVHGGDIAPGELLAERSSYDEVVLAGRLRDAITRLNSHIPAEAREEALRKVLVPETPSLVQNNRAFHRLLTDGVPVEFTNQDGRIVHDYVKLIDFEESNNDWLAVNQFTIIENGVNRRPDIIIFVNGLPLAVVELKNPADEDATIWTAFNQLQTYKHQIPSIFNYNELLIISDGLAARVGSLTADKERFAPWRTINGETVAPVTKPQLHVLFQGLLEKRRLLDFINNFVVFEEENGFTAKKIAGYHQFHAVRKAIDSAVTASRPKGDRRCGVIWHTQGSGKSLTMTFFARKIVLHPKMENPTLVLLTDRNDLDDQLFGTFSRCSDISNAL